MAEISRQAWTEEEISLSWPLSWWLSLLAWFMHGADQRQPAAATKSMAAAKLIKEATGALRY
ncbi:MAG: hypothetical protein RI601_04860 [Desulfurivibrionaceae bacterium]|nr:hypothetical protein [Desulfurivibrionaceae bacterium]